MFKLVSVTNRRLACRPLLQQMEFLMEAGVKTFILREKDLPEEEYRMLAGEALALGRKHGAVCILHSFAGTAADLQARGLHLPLPALKDLAPEKRRLFPVLGASCHSLQDAREAVSLGCTYITLGHIFVTDCKKGLPPRGLDLLRKVCAAVPVPVYAIGGITPENIVSVREAGAAGACQMSSLMAAGQSEAVSGLVQRCSPEA